MKKIFESKIGYHKSRAKLPFEEKIKIIIELQKIDAEMRKKKLDRLQPEYYRIWQIE